MPLDPFEEFWLKDEAEAAAEGSLLASSFQPNYAPPILSSDVLSPPSSSGDCEGDEDDDEEDEEENTEVQIDDAITRRRLKEAEMARMRTILSTFTEAQMKRYEAFRRSALSKSKMNRLLTKIFGKDVMEVVGKDAQDINIVVSALAKMFTGDLVQAARVVMTERNDIGPIRPCHIIESYRRLKLEGKTFKPKSVPRPFY